MTSFAQIHAGDKIRTPLRDGWSAPVRVVDEPHLCADAWCTALHCKALSMDGMWVEPVSVYPSTEVWVLEYGPASELAAREGDVLAEHAEPLDPYSEHCYRMEKAS